MKRFREYFLIAICLAWFFNISIGIDMNRLESLQMDQSGDGLKNYYTFAYHLKYSDDLDFKGFLYPEGDLTFFTDSQFAINLILKTLGTLGLEVENPLLVLNVLILLGFLIGAFIIFEIFMLRGMSHTYAIALSVICMAMSPQILRAPSHFGLAYPYFFLMCWYLIERSISRRGTIGLSPLICLPLVLIFAGFVHPYQLLIGSFFVGAYGFIDCFKNIKRGTSLLVVAALPLILYQLVFLYIDTAVDRPKNPYGIWAYQTSLADLLPGFGIVGDYFNDRKVSLFLDEGYAYPTILVYGIALVLIYQFVMSKVKGLKNHLKLTHLEKNVFLSALICLCFSFGLHLKIFGNPLLEILPPLRQFRALGRFSWPFYYVSFVTAGVLFYRMFLEDKKKFSRDFAFVAIVFVLFLESFSYHSDFNKIVKKYETKDLLRNEKSIQNILDAQSTSSQFQAIIPIPPSTEGAEKINLKTDYFIKTRALPYSYQTETPLTSAIMSRVSISKMMKSLELTNGPYGFKSCQAGDFKSNEPFLLLVNNDYTSDYIDVLNRSEHIGSDEHISLYAMNLSDLLAQEDYEISSESIDLSEGHNVDSLGIVYRDFQGTMDVGIDQRKGVYLLAQGNGEILDVSLDIIQGKTYELSFWHKMMDDRSTVPSFELVFYQNDDVVYRDSFRDWDLKRVEVYNEWARYSRKYTLDNQADRLSLTVNGSYVVIDNLLFKPDDVDVHEVINERLAYANGYMVKPLFNQDFN